MGGLKNEIVERDPDQLNGKLSSDINVCYVELSCVVMCYLLCMLYRAKRMVVATTVVGTC